MAKTREGYQVNAQDLNGLIFRLNAALSRIADRLDKLEGLRGEMETEGAKFSGDIEADSDVFVNDSNGDRIHSME